MITTRLCAPVSVLISLLKAHDDARTITTKSGEAVAVVRLTGLDFEGLSDEAREHHVRQVANALRILDTSTTFYLYLTKDYAGILNGQPTYSMSVHVALAVDAKARATRKLFQRRTALLMAAMESARQTLAAQLQILVSRLGAFSPVELSSAEAFAFFARLVNGPSTTVHLLSQERLDDQLPGVMVECARDGTLRVGGVPVRVLSMKTSPRATYPLMLRDLYGLNGEFICCLEWRGVDPMTVKWDIVKRFQHNRPYPPQFVEQEQALLAAAQDDITIHGRAFGQASLTLAIRGDSPKIATDAQRIFAMQHDGAFIVETLNALDAWAAMLPGNRDRNIRRRLLTERNAADLACLFGVATGFPRSITTLRTQQDTAFDFSLHVADVGHTLILGATGSGKTTLARVITDAVIRAEHARTIIFDLGHSYQGLADRVGGAVARFEQGKLPPMNPFAGEPTPEHLFFLRDFCTVLAEGTTGERLPDRDTLRQEMHDRLLSLFVLDRHDIRLGTFVRTLPKPLQIRLAPWVSGGMYGHVFDHEVDRVTVNDCQVFEFLGGLEDHPDVLAPLLFYVLHRVNAYVGNGRMVFCLMDEAWKFLAHPALRDYVKQALKTWRKHNGVMVLASQALEDLRDVDLLHTVIESCPTTVFLPNQLRNKDLYTRTFNLNPRELEMLDGLVVGEMLLKRPELSKVLTVVPLSEGITA